MRDGEAAALAELYDLVAGRAFGLAVQILRDQGAAEDAVHDAFEQLWRQRDRIDPARGRVDALALTVVRRRALDIARSSGRRARRNVALSEVLDLADPAVEDVGLLLDRAVDAEQVRSALDGLPTEQRRVVDLAYFKGMTMAEIGEELDVAVGTVKSRARLALQKLRDQVVIGERDE